MEGFCVDQIVELAKVTALVILFVSAAGVGWHVWLCRSLAFVNFEDERPEKKDKMRLFLPMGVVMFICFLLPVFIVFFSSPDLRDCINNPEYRQFVQFPWSVFLPAISWWVTVMVDGIVGGISYWIFGTILWFFVGRK